MPIENKTKQVLTLKKSTPLGEVKKCGEQIGDNTVLAFNIAEIEEAMKDIENEENGQRNTQNQKMDNKSDRSSMKNSVNNVSVQKCDSHTDKQTKKSILKQTDGKNGRPPDKMVHFEESQTNEGETKMDNGEQSSRDVQDIKINKEENKEAKTE